MQSLLDDLSIFDFLLAPIYILLIWVIADFVKNKNILEHPEYKYFVRGLLVKILGAISLGLVYYFYYTGGDTTNYFETARAYVNLSVKNQADFFHGWLGDATGVDWEFFDSETGYPVYFHKDKHAFFVVRLLIPLTMIAFKSYFTCTVLVATITYSGVWKLYRVFVYEFPELKKEMAIAVLFIPSCIFWGSGILKDSFTLSAVGWYTYAFHSFFIRKKRNYMFLIEIFISAYILISIKPYILFALLPGSIIWLSGQWIARIKNKTFKVILGPIFMIAGLATAYIGLTQLEDVLGLYKVDTVLEHASVVQKDMKADYYGGNSFDIGDFDSDVGSIIAKAPIAIFSGIFRPGLWDVKNIVMFVSSLENTYLLLLTCFLLIKLKLYTFFNMIGKNAMLLFCMLFALFFAFSVGLTVANFGSLVRLRIPELPFFVSGIFILRHLYELKSGKKVRF
ncbi:MAG TPA: hypothetical protein VNY73_10790 [Bacteroidia bacterium]|jgi:hypothetical protein|nr:hypothetical protein [Bacteroidia bacterium]